jgi:hypothetical protein
VIALASKAAGTVRRPTLVSRAAGTKRQILTTSEVQSAGQAAACAHAVLLGQRVQRIENRRLKAEYVDQEAAQAASMAYLLSKLMCDPPKEAAVAAPPAVSSGGGGGGGSSMDKAKLDALINQNAPFAPAPRQ